MRSTRMRRLILNPKQPYYPPTTRLRDPRMNVHAHRRQQIAGTALLQSDHSFQPRTAHTLSWAAHVRRGSPPLPDIEIRVEKGRAMIDYCHER